MLVQSVFFFTTHSYAYMHTFQVYLLTLCIHISYMHILILSLSVYIDNPSKLTEMTLTVSSLK